MAMVATCPYCGTDLVEDESLDTMVEPSVVYNALAGHCEDCGRNFQWVEKFEYLGFDGLEEVDTP